MAKATATTATPNAVDQTTYNPDKALEIGFENISDTNIVTVPDTYAVTVSPMPDADTPEVTIDGITVTPTKRMCIVHVPTGTEFELHRVCLSKDTATTWNFTKIGQLSLKGLGQTTYIGIKMDHSGDVVESDLIACSMVRQNRRDCKKDSDGCSQCPLNVLTLKDIQSGSMSPDPSEFELQIRNN